MPQPQKNSRISLAIGAAPVTASRSRPPNSVRTNSAFGATGANASRRSSGTASPRISRSWICPPTARVVGPDRLGPRAQQLLVAPVAAAAHVIERDRVGHLARRIHDDDLAQLGQPLADRHDLGHLLGVLADHEDRLRVAGHPLALLG